MTRKHGQQGAAAQGAWGGWSPGGEGDWQVITHPSEAMNGT